MDCHPRIPFARVDDHEDLQRRHDDFHVCARHFSIQVGTNGSRQPQRFHGLYCVVGVESLEFRVGTEG